MVLAALTLVSIPFNWFTADWADRAGQNSTQCNAPITWDQTALGIYLPLTFIVLALGCLVAAIVTRIRTRHTLQPVGFGDHRVVTLRTGLCSRYRLPGLAKRGLHQLVLLNGR